MVWDILFLMIFCFFIGFGVVVVMVIINSYLVEFFFFSVCGKYIFFCVMIGLIGVLIINIVFVFVILFGLWGWRFVFVWGVVGFIYFFFICCFEELFCWYENCGEFVKVDVIFNRIEV